MGAGRKGEGSDLFGQYPPVGEGGLGLGIAGGFALERVKSHLKVRVAVAHRGMGTQIDDFERQFLPQLPPKGLGSCLALLPFAPWQFPEAAKEPIRGALGYQETSASPYDPQGNLQEGAGVPGRPWRKSLRITAERGLAPA